jgi:hypothetical protein
MPVGNLKLKSASLTKASQDKGVNGLFFSSIGTYACGSSNNLIWKTFSSSTPGQSSARFSPAESSYHPAGSIVPSSNLKGQKNMLWEERYHQL